MASGRNDRPVRGARRTGREQASEPFRWRQWLQRAGLLVVVAGLAVASWQIGHWALAELDRPVGSVNIHGEFTRVSREDVASRIYRAMGSSFFNLDLERVQQQLEAAPWIDRAQVERRWPDRLEVTVIEHKPIARWGSKDALNHRGEVIELSRTAADRETLAGLPVLEGLQGMERDMMAQYQTFNQLLQEQGLSVVKLSRDAVGNWSLQLDDGVTLRLGRNQLLKKMGRFLVVYESRLQQRWAELESVDLRYENGLAVQWRQTAEIQENGTETEK